MRRGRPQTQPHKVHAFFISAIRHSHEKAGWIVDSHERNGVAHGVATGVHHNDDAAS